MGFKGLQNQNRTDRILILVALAILLLASGLFYFDNWMWGGRHKRGEPLGVISARAGDVRVKFEGELKWGRATPGQDLVYNDSIYAGSDSQAQLQLGQSDMTVTENTLVVLRREQNVNFMNLSYGSLFGNIAKSEKVVIDTGEGRPIELSSKTRSSIVVKKSRGGHTELEVKSGEVDLLVNGKKTRVGKNTRISMDGKSAPKVESVELELIKPKSSEIVYSEEPARLDFAWKWSNNRRPAAGDKFTVEFSSSRDFESVYAKRQVNGAMNTSMNASQSLSMYYRVRGPNGELSSVEKVNYIHLQKPLIVKPVANSQFVVPSDRNAQIEIEFHRPPRANSVWYQVSNDPSFNSVLSVDNTPDAKQVREFPPGQYFLRAKSDYGDNHESSWTPGIPFTVERKMEGLALAKLSLPTKVLIPNVAYPPSLYRTDGPRVREYLARQGFLHRFFPFDKKNYDQINLKFAGESTLTNQKGSAWPTEKMKPAKYSYNYQVEKQGFDPSPWSEEKKLEIAMEPPHPTGEPQYGAVNAAGETEVKWTFTPLLYAHTYDVQLANNPGMLGAREWSVSRADAKASISGENYWRARARDKDGNVISDYSKVHKLTAPVVQRLASREQPRRPSSVENSNTARVERLREEPFEKTGWWTWFGLGESYVDYRQSNQGRGALTNGDFDGPSQYLEVGFAGKNAWGGIFTATQTPGKVDPSLPDGSTIDNKSYKWTAMSFEGIYKKVSPLNLFGTPIVYGLRLGVQQHHLPFVFLDSDANLEMKYNNATNLSAGALAEWTRRRWTYYWLMRYQYPLSTSADGSSQFNLNPVFAFDGSVGTSYNITRQLKAGLFWYGQWHQFNFSYSDGQVANTGFQSLFYSNLNFRLGWDF